MARFLRLAARARVGMLIHSSLGAGRDRALDWILEAFEDDRPVLMYGQPTWPPSERPTKIRADISSGVRTKADLFSRLAHATTGAALVATSDCGLPLFDLVEASLRSGVQLIYLSWSAQGDGPQDLARDVLACAAQRSSSERTALAQALPSALPIWIGVDHAPNGDFCIGRVREANFDRGAGVTLQDLFIFAAEGSSPDRALVGSFLATGFVPWCLDQMAREANASASQLASELFDVAPVPGATAADFARTTAQEAMRGRRLRAERFDPARRA